MRRSLLTAMSYGHRGSLLRVDATQPVVMRMSGRLTPDDVPRLCEELSALLIGSGATEAICDAAGLRRADLTAVNALARMQLTARGLGCRIRLRNAGPELRELLELVGLGEVA